MIDGYCVHCGRFKKYHKNPRVENPRITRLQCPDCIFKMNQEWKKLRSEEKSDFLKTSHDDDYYTELVKKYNK